MSEGKPFESNCLAIASCALDAANPTKRKILLNDVISSVQNEASSRKLLTSKFGAHVVEVCSSSSSYQRVFKIILKAYTSHFEAILSGSDDEKSQADETNSLAKLICKTLKNWYTLEANQKTNTKKKKRFPSLADVANELVVPLCKETRDTKLNCVMLESFFSILKQVDTIKNKGEFATAISLLQCLIATLKTKSNIVDVEGYRKTMIEYFVKRALSVGKFASSIEIDLASYFIKTLTQEEFDQHIASTIALKLRGNPESIIETATAITAALIQSTSISGLSLLKHLEGDSKLLSSTIRQIRSPKHPVREHASSLVFNLAMSSPNLETVPPVLKAVSEALLGTKSGMSLSSPEQREAAYISIINVTEKMHKLIPSTKENELDLKAIKDSLSLTLEAISAAQGKEQITNMSTNSAGMKALFSLLMLSYSMNCKTSKGCTSTSKYLSKPALDAVGKSSLNASTVTQFRHRIGSMLSMIEESFMESLIGEMFKSDNKLQKGLESIIDNSMKKFRASSRVVQIDGLMAIYLLLVQCTLKDSMVMPSSILKILSGNSTSSFLYGEAMLDDSGLDPIVVKLLPRCIAIFCKILSRDEENRYAEKSVIFDKMFLSADCNDVKLIDTKTSGAADGIAACIVNPDLSSSGGTLDPSKLSIDLKSILTYTPKPTETANAIVNSIFKKVNIISQHIDDASKGLGVTRESREVFEPTCDISSIEKYRGKLFSSNHRGCDSCNIRHVGYQLSSHISNDVLGKLMMLIHIGSSTKDNGKQRNGLTTKIQQIISNVALTKSISTKENPLLEPLGIFFSACAITADKGDGKDVCGTILGTTIHEAALSLIVSLGSLAGNFDPEFDDPDDDELAPFAFARYLCIEYIAPKFASKLMQCTMAIEAFTSYDLDLYRSKDGVLVADVTNNGDKIERSKNIQNVDKKRPVKSRKQKGDFGAGFEEEEWERQVKKEIAAKKQDQGNSTQQQLSKEDKELLRIQSKKRKEMSDLISIQYYRSLSSIQALAKSDIEIGNACLPIFANCIIASVSSNAPAFKTVQHLKKKSFKALCVLSTCIFEIDEMFANELAQSIEISYRSRDKIVTRNDTNDEEKGDLDDSKHLDTSALPSPCPAAAAIISELDEYNDCLSESSFAFIFPVLRAALAGPRTIPGCESALRILHMHTSLFTSETTMLSSSLLRRQMVLTVLELLSHDRSQTYSDPTPIETLCSCYTVPESEEINGSLFSPGELAPLLGEKGSLAGKNCRIGSMVTLGSIASKYPSSIKNNPLIENRIWINCFEADKEIQHVAREAWYYANGISDQNEQQDIELPVPSQIYSIPLLPLLDHESDTIADSAASAFAHAMGKHPVTVERNIKRLCDTYIEAFPTVLEESKPNVTAPPPKVQPKIKKITKKPKSKLGAPSTIGKARSRKTKSTINIPKPKQRGLDQSTLKSQFLSESSKANPGKDNEKKVRTRLGILRVIIAVTDSSAKVSIELPILKMLISFLMAYGLADSDEFIRNKARNASRDIVSKFGDQEDSLEFLLPHLEAVLNTGKADESFLGDLSSEKVLRDTIASDRRKEGAVLCLGSAAIHLKGEDNLDKIDTTIDMLIGALRTPSEGVQSSVALCLSKLMKKGRTPDRIADLLSRLMLDCLNGDSLAVRRGSAYGISAVIKGSGISSLKKYEVIKQLDEACSSSASSSKEGALFTIELLSARLGLLFEPYVIVLLPALLKAFSDSSDHVRMAAAGTVDLIMSKLSAHGVKLVMPAVLTAFGEPAWRTKQASIHMLGSMSNCAPKQLANCLPKVVPRLTEAFSDTHPKVKSSAEDALKQICKVIKNPEISSISPVLLKALIDPANETITALEALIETEFLHAIDSPSLALLIPVLHRGLRDRSAKTKRYGALISGNICTMINDPRDFIPYLPTLLPDLKSVLLDPIPDVRSTASKALGSLTRGLGEDSLPDLRSWLIETLKSDVGTSVERSGAAQGLTEVLVAGGAGLVEDVMREEILPLRSHPQASTREGVLWVLTFMPSSLGHAFTPLIDVSLPALLAGLSDDNEQIREVALRAGRVLIRSHGKAHVYKILPSLEDGLLDDDWRIRVSSLTLLGDLLSLIGGTKIVKGDSETQDDIRQAERAQAQIALSLGSDTRKRILSGVYFARSDIASVVRQSAVQVWKTVVSVTARTLREILDVLVGKIVKALASGHPEQTQVAGRCLGDIVRKLGDTVLPEIIPVLRDKLTRGDQNTRRGACIGLTEVIESSSKDQLDKFLNILLKAVQEALGDEDDDVRKMAASCFQSLHNVVGSRASDEVVPSLLVAMETSYDDISRQRALKGLTGILSIRSRELLPYLVHRLTSRPISKNNADALATISSVTGSTLHPFFRTIIPSLLTELEIEQGDEDAERIESIRDCARAIFGNVDADSVDWLISEIANKCTNDKEGIRKESCWMIGVLVEERKESGDFYEQIPTMYRELLYRLNDSIKDVVKTANAALLKISKCVSAEELVNHIEFCRNLVASIVSEARRRKGGVGDGEFLLPGFNMPKGLEPLLPMYQRGILYGDANIREVAAAGLGELISITSNKFLAGPFIIKLTGPLLRVVGDRNPSAVKIAIVQTLGLILTKGGLSLRAFVPQFQTTFVKALSDPSRQVRVEAIKALALLMPLSTRLDPLIKELVSGSLGRGATTSIEIGGVVAVQTATLDALACVLNNGGRKAKLPDSIPSALSAGKELLFHEDEGIREGAAKAIGAACNVMGKDVATEVIEEVILNNAASDMNDIKHAKACTGRYVFSSSCGKEIDPDISNQVVKLIVGLMDDQSNRVKEAACVAVGAVLGSSQDPSSDIKTIQPAILKNMKTSEDIEVHKSIAKGLSICVSLNKDIFDGDQGSAIIGASLKLAMSGTQKVQFAFNEFLWLAMNIEAGESSQKLEKYYSVANFENARTMKTLATKVLSRIKGVEVDI